MPEHKILIIEDSPTMRQLIRFALKRLQGVRIVEVNDGVDGLKKLSADKFDLILTDINMPIMDGLKLIAHVRQEDAVHKVTPVVVITTEAAPEDRRRAMALGASAYLVKPLRAPTVISTVRELLKLP